MSASAPSHDRHPDRRDHPDSKNAAQIADRASQCRYRQGAYGARLTIAFTDLERAIAIRDPQLGELFVRYLDQEDPEPGRDELAPAPQEDDAPIDVPPGATTIDSLHAAMRESAMANKTPTERKLARREAFAAAEASPFAPPRLRIAPLVMQLADGDAELRAALYELIARTPVRWGIWKAIKTLYKRAEETHDLPLFAVIAYRLDRLSAMARKDIGPGTVKYMRRRAWRYLRQLGAATPETYVAYAVEMLRHYPVDCTAYETTWVAPHIFRHRQLRFDVQGTASFWAGAIDLASRAFPDAWKLSPAPLLGLLEAANNGYVCEFAIASLRGDHPLALRAVEPTWLARLGRRPLAAIHTFVVSLLRESPEFHQSKLKALGLHDVVLGFLRSESSEARAYAIEYAAAHAPDIAVPELVELVETGATEVAKFAAARLESVAPTQLGLANVLRLAKHAAAPWAETKLGQGFSPRDVTVEMFLETSLRPHNDGFGVMLKFFNDKQIAVPTNYWTRLVDDPRSKEWQVRTARTTALQELGKRTARDIGIPWIQKALEDRDTTDVVVRWLDAGMLAGNDLDVEWLKGLVGKPRLRPVALRLLGDRRRVTPARVGLAWLLDLARSSDADLSQFAQRMLLESFQPADFADGAAGDQAGVARLWELATGKKSPEAVRAFAQTYLKAHHPDLGPRLAEAKALGIKPRLDHAAYPLTTVRPLFADDRLDVRRLAVAIAGDEIERWGDQELVYELAGSSHKDVRALGSELLLGTIVEGDARRVPAAWIDGRKLFQLAESPHKGAREVALTLIRKLYAHVGGAERLAWLMESPEREVRLFAVRLFWERHRPKPWTADYVPRKQAGAALGTERFSDLPALRQFARVVLFGLPPGRVGERDAVIEGAPKPERALPASIAKKRLIEALRDVGLEDVDLANAIAPVLAEFTSSTAKGEWQASLQAITALRAQHGAAFVADGGRP